MPASADRQIPLTGIKVSRATCHDVLTRIAGSAPRVQCVTNTVAQAITANCLLAIGAQVSMAIHPAEIIDMTSSADAVLINLGTLDPLREQTIAMLADMPELAHKPLVLDPVFVEYSPLRMALALGLIGHGNLIIRANGAEMQALLGKAPASAMETATRVTTGAVDHIISGARAAEIQGGHPLMRKVTGLGCALGAVIAACAAVEPDPLIAASVALMAFNTAAETAAAEAAGPASFATAFIDALANLEFAHPLEELRNAL